MEMVEPSHACSGVPPLQPSSSVLPSRRLPPEVRPRLDAPLADARKLPTTPPQCTTVPRLIPSDTPSDCPDCVVRPYPLKTCKLQRCMRPKRMQRQPADSASRIAGLRVGSAPLRPAAPRGARAIEPYKIISPPASASLPIDARIDAHRMPSPRHMRRDVSPSHPAAAASAPRHPPLFTVPPSPRYPPSPDPRPTIVTGPRAPASRTCPHMSAVRGR